MPSRASSRAIRSASVAQVVDQLEVLADPARDQLRWRDLAGAVAQRDRRHDDQDAVLREPAAVAERDVLDVTDAETVDERDPCSRPDR